MPRRAFTLIELLVVVAVVAILAAILFPVFAQAKAAAKKTSCLANLRQIGLGDAMYLADHEDVYPLQLPHLREPSGQWQAGWQWNGVIYTPADWDAGETADFVQANAAAWPNSAQPYLKGWAVLSSPAQRPTDDDAGMGILTASAVHPKQPVNYSFNGLLTEYPASAVAAPSRLIAFWQGYGDFDLPGVANPNPTLFCPYPDEPCRYRPSPKDGDCGRTNGDGDFVWWWSVGSGTAWGHPGGINVAMADGSAKFRQIGANLGGRTDYRSDPFLFYGPTGRPESSYYDDQTCHALLFRPDFEFRDWGNPTYSDR